MKRRTVLAGLGSAAAGSAVAFSTGAFTNLSADRTVTVDVAPDSNGALTIQENDNSGPHPTSDPSTASSAATTSVTTSDYSAYANNGTSFPGPNDTLEALDPYAGDSSSLVSENNGKIELSIGDYSFASGVNQGTVVFEDLIRVQNNSGTALSLGATKSGDNNVNLDILTTDPGADGDPGDADGQTVSLLNNNVTQSFAGSWGGVTILLNPDGTVTGETVTVSLTAEPV